VGLVVEKLLVCGAEQNFEAAKIQDVGCQEFEALRVLAWLRLAHVEKWSGFKLGFPLHHQLGIQNFTFFCGTFFPYNFGIKASSNCTMDETVTAAAKQYYHGYRDSFDSVLISPIQMPGNRNRRSP